MFPALACAIEQLDIPVDGDALAAAFGLRDRLEARLAAAVDLLDRSERWHLDGATSVTAWLADLAGMARARASATARQARLVAQLPLTAASWADGRLSSGQVEAICANLTVDLVGLFAEHEAQVLPDLYPLSTADVATAMRRWRSYADDRPPTPDRPQSLHAARLLDGQTAVKGSLDTETGEMLAAALRVAQTPDSDGEPARTPGTRRADALADICRFFLHNQDVQPAGSRHRPHLNLVYPLAPDGTIDLRGARTAAGIPLDHITADRLLCDSLLYRVLVTGKSAIIDYGRATRAIPPPLWNVTLLRDQHCRWRGCDRPGHWCEAHHVVPWTTGGETKLANLVLLCSRHHHLLHQPDWHARLSPSGDLVITDPRGRVRTTSPPATGPPGTTPLPLAS
jgi:hypothetical protein